MGERESEDQTLLGQHRSGSQDVHRAAPLRTLLLGQLHTDADDNDGDDRQVSDKNPRARLILLFMDRTSLYLQP